MTVTATHAPAAPAPVRPAAPPPRPAPAPAAPTARWDLGSVAVTAPPVEDSGWIPDAFLDEVRSLVRALPGYSLASAAVGQDLLTGRPLTRGLGETLELLLSQAGPFGAGVGRVLGALDVLGELMGSVSRAFAEHDVSFARVVRDIRAAWGRFEASLLVDGNVAIVRGYVTAFVADVRAAVSDLVADLLATVRAAVGHLVEPLLADPAVAPVWNLAVKVMGVNPLTGQAVDAPTVEILADFLSVIGQSGALEQMRERGTLQRTADWLDTQLATFHELVGLATALFTDAWNAISPANLPNLLETLPGLARRAIGLFQRVVQFGTTVIGTVLEYVKDSLLGMLSERARQVPGFRLLTVILGRDPFTGAAVPRTAEALIGGFIELLPGGQETYQRLSETGVIAAAAARIEGEMSRLNISWDLVTGTFRAIWDQMSLADLLDPIGAIQRVIDRFGEPLGRIVSFAATVIEVVIELVLTLMNVPTELLAGLLAGVSAALADIKRDPVAFLQNILAALKAGFQRFFDNILVHLMAGLAGWLFRGLRGLGIEPPTELSGAAVLDLVLDVLGLSVDFLWERLAVAVGQERVDQIRGALDTLGQAWAFIGDVQERGLVAVWEYLSGQLGMLWETILSTARDWLMTNLVQAAITKVLSMLDPTGIMAVVNSAIAFFRAVQSVIDYLTELLQIVKTYVDTLAAIARGDITPGAAMLEQGLANAIPVAIGFLANQVGLGNVPEKIVEIIGRLRALVTRALDWLIAQALRLGAAALRALGGGDGEQHPPGTSGTALDLPATRTPLSMSGEGHALWFQRVGSTYQVFMASDQPARLVTRAQEALADPDCPDGAKVYLREAVRQLSELEAEVAESERLYRNTTVLDSRILGSNLTVHQFRDRLTAQLVIYRTGLEGLGQAFSIKSLTNLGHPSRFVTEDSIAPQYRSASVWRRTFYGGWRSGVRDPKVREARDAARSHWLAQHPGAVIPAGFDLFHCAECDGYYSPGGNVPGYARRRLTVDHRRPVVNHFNAEGDGRNMIQSERESWYNDPQNLDPMCHVCNQDAERVTNWTVTARFRGPGDAP